MTDDDRYSPRMTALLWLFLIAMSCVWWLGLVTMVQWVWALLAG